ncbi:MAG: pilus assembly protein TadE [Caulobacter sp.]|nr:pilus assembly protein TadE [Caulobacter sp.]
MAKTRKGARPLPIRFAADRRGATAVEFALVAAPFLLLLFALLELGMVSLVSITLENAVLDESRKIRTGQIQSTTVTASGFKDGVCGQMSWLTSRCDGALSIDVRSFTTFGPSQTAFKAARPAVPCWDTGGPGSVVLVRAYYTWPLITPLMQTGLQSADGKRVITAATAFANEPYTDTTVAPSC